MTQFKIDPPLACSFCGRTREQVRTLIAAPRVCICDECVHISSGLLSRRKGAMRVIDLSDETITALKNYDAMIRVHGPDDVGLCWEYGVLLYEGGGTHIEHLAREGFTHATEEIDADDHGLQP